MGDEENLYEVVWGRDVRLTLAEMEEFRVDPKLVFNKTNHLLARLPRRAAYDVVEFKDFEFNGYYWVLINNVVVVYFVSGQEKRVFVDTCFFANTAWAHQIFWGIEPEEDD